MVQNPGASMGAQKIIAISKEKSPTIQFSPELHPEVYVRL